MSTSSPGTAAITGEVQHSFARMELMFDEFIAKQEMLLNNCAVMEGQIDVHKVNQMLQTQVYLKKLTTLRKEMLALHQKAGKLKQRARTLEIVEAEKRQRRQTQQEQLVAKPRQEQ